MVRRAYANGDIYLGTYEGWYCPNEGFRNATDVVETARGTICPNHPDVPLQWLTERNWFFRLSAYQERLERHFADHPDFVQPDYRRNEMLGFIRGGLEDFSISRERTPGDWGIPFPVAENGESSQREDGTWDPEAGKIYVWFDALINYITGAGFPDDRASFERFWPADLHVIGKDIARFHTIIWPAMLWSAGLEAPRQVWVHGWLLAAGGERMSKSRGNFLDPNDFVTAFGQDGARYVALREVPVRSRRRGELGLVRPALQRRPRQRLREPRQPDGVDDQPVPGRRAARAQRRRLAPGRLGAGTAGLPNRPSSAACCTRRWPRCGTSSAPPTGWSTPRSRGSSPSWPRPATPTRTTGLRGVLGDLLEACRLLGLAGAPFLPATAPRVLAQLGYDYPYGADGNGGPPIRGLLEWGSGPGTDGRVTRSRATLPAARDRIRGVLAPTPARSGTRIAPGSGTGPAGYHPGVRLIDSHCHLNADRFDGDLDLVVGGARLAGVERVLVPGWDVASSERALGVVDRYPWMDAGGRRAPA